MAEPKPNNQQPPPPLEAIARLLIEQAESQPAPVRTPAKKED